MRSTITASLLITLMTIGNAYAASSACPAVSDIIQVKDEQEGGYEDLAPDLISVYGLAPTRMLKSITSRRLNLPVGCIGISVRRAISLWCPATTKEKSFSRSRA